MGNLTNITIFKYFSGLTMTASKSLPNSTAQRYGQVSGKQNKKILHWNIKLTLIINLKKWIWKFYFSQESDKALQNKIDSVKKYHIIYSLRQDVTSTEITKSTSSTPGYSSTSRGISFDFHIGVDGPLQSISTAKAKNLEKIIKNDPEAYAEFKNALVHIRKKRINNLFEYISYVGLIGSFFPLTYSLVTYQDNGITGLTIGSGVGLVVSLAGTVIFNKATDKQMDKWAESIEKSIQIYNKNLLAKIK